MVNFVEGILKIAVVVLSLIAGAIALSLFKISSKRELLRPWKVLIVALIFFVLQEIFGALRAFKIYDHPFLTHIIPTFIVGFLILAVTFQINLIKHVK